MDLRDLGKEQLAILEDILRNNPKLTSIELLDLVRKEKSRRSEPQLKGPEITKKFLLKYVRFELCDGLGSYEVWKVKRIDVDDDRKQYSLYSDSPIVSNVDGDYSIDTYLEEVTIETDSDLKKFTVIDKEEYDQEFQKALDYYKNLKKD
jgi:hypothetical protein